MIVTTIKCDVCKKEFLKGEPRWIIQEASKAFARGEYYKTKDVCSIACGIKVMEEEV